MNIQFFKKSSAVLFILLLLVLLIPSFWRMLKPGIFSMHDFHVFRLYEYDKCVSDWQFPCRWAPDATYEYGQPVFNFYAQLPYLFGEVFRFLGLSVLDSIKALFISSLVLSALGMFLLSKQLWKNNYSAVLSALVYTYAPYRAVDVYVRGALPEALSFVFFPFITYFFNDYVLTKNKRSLWLFALFFAGLIITHNLSALMYLFFLTFWGLYFLYLNKAWRMIPMFLLAGVLSAGLVAFYVLPVGLETKLVALNNTVDSYYSFKLHYATLNQLLISTYWGYGASLWGEGDFLSLSVGHLQWILPILVLGVVSIKRSFRQNKNFFATFLLGWFFLFLTHGKSEFLWETIKPLSYIQFPWRFLGSAVFAFSICVGAVFLLVKKELLKVFAFSVLASVVIALNANFFFEDLWFDVNDKEFFSGANYEQQVSSAINDFWPRTAKETPRTFAPKDPIIIEGSGSATLVEKRSNRASYKVNLESETGVIQVPIVYFPGWVAKSDTRELSIYPSGDYGVITAAISKQDQQINLHFTDTPVRRIGNYISLGSFLVFAGLMLSTFKKSNKHE